MHSACLETHGQHQRLWLACSPKNMVGEGVDTQGASAHRLPGGWWNLNDTSALEPCGGFEHRCRHGVQGPLGIALPLQHVGCRQELHDTVVGDTTDVLSAGVGWAFQAAAHHSGFTCHRSASKHPYDHSLYDISAHGTNHGRATASFFPRKQSLRGGHYRMMHGWTVCRLLEEESEHQWLTLHVALFVLFGAFAIDATEHFVGDRITVTAQHQGGLFSTSNTRTTHPTPPLSSLQEHYTCLPSMSMTDSECGLQSWR